MSRWRVEFEFEVDDEALEEHDGDKKPPPNDVTDWYDSDLFTAHTLGIVELDHDTVNAEKVDEG